VNDFWNKLLKGDDNWEDPEYIAALEALRMEDMAPLHATTLPCTEHTSTLGFVAGNYTADEAGAIATRLQAVRGGEQGADRAPHFDTRLVSPPAGSSYRLRAPTVSESQTNSCCCVMYQTYRREGPIEAWIGACAVQSVLSAAFKADFFSTLRTEEQLGYLVSSGTSVKEETRYLAFSVQSEAYPAEYLESRVDNWVQGNLRAILHELSPDKFEEYRSAQLQDLVAKPKTPGEENRKVWKHIANRTYHWEYEKRLAEALRRMKQGELMQFYESYISAAAGTAVRLALHVNGRASTAEEKVAPLPAATEITTKPQEWKASMFAQGHYVGEAMA